MNAKNYAVAFEKYSEYLKLTNNQDSVTAYNCGVCADNIKKYIGQGLPKLTPVEIVGYEVDESGSPLA